MEFIRKNKTGLLLGIITGTAVLILSPVVDYIGNLILDFFLKLNDNFSKSYYQNIAANDEGRFSEFNNFILSLFFIAAIFILLEFLKRKEDELHKRVSDGLKRIDFKNKKIIQPEQDVVSTTEVEKKITEKEKEITEAEKKIIETEKKIIELGEEISKSKHKIGKRSSEMIFFYVCGFSLSILLLSNYIFDKSVSRQNNAFKNNIIAIEPYVSDTITDRLKSDWVRIKNEDDFNQVKRKTDSIISTLDIKK